MCFHQSRKINNNTPFSRTVADNDKTLSFQHNQKINHKNPQSEALRALQKKKKYAQITNTDDVKFVSLISVALPEGKFIPKTRLTIGFSMKLKDFKLSAPLKGVNSSLL